MSDGRPRLGDLLVDLGFIDEAQLEEALQKQRRLGHRLGKILVDSAIITEDRLVHALARQLGMDTCDPVVTPIHPKVLEIIPASVALHHRVLPLARKREGDSEVIYVALADPLDTQSMEAVRQQVGMNVRLHWMLAGETEMELALEKHLGAAASAPPARPAPSSPPGGATYQGVPVVQGLPLGRDLPPRRSSQSSGSLQPRPPPAPSPRPAPSAGVPAQPPPAAPPPPSHEDRFSPLPPGAELTSTGSLDAAFEGAFAEPPEEELPADAFEEVDPFEDADDDLPAASAPPQRLPTADLEVLPEDEAPDEHELEPIPLERFAEDDGDAADDAEPGLETLEGDAIVELPADASEEPDAVSEPFIAPRRPAEPTPRAQEVPSPRSLAFDSADDDALPPLGPLPSAPLSAGTPWTDEREAAPTGSPVPPVASRSSPPGPSGPSNASISSNMSSPEPHPGPSVSEAPPPGPPPSPPGPPTWGDLLATGDREPIPDPADRSDTAAPDTAAPNEPAGPHPTGGPSHGGDAVLAAFATDPFDDEAETPTPPPLEPDTPELEASDVEEIPEEEAIEVLDAESETRELTRLDASTASPAPVEPEAEPPPRPDAEVGAEADNETTAVDEASTTRPLEPVRLSPAAELEAPTPPPALGDDHPSDAAPGLMAEDLAAGGAAAGDAMDSPWGASDTETTAGLGARLSNDLDMPLESRPAPKTTTTPPPGDADPEPAEAQADPEPEPPTDDVPTTEDVPASAGPQQLAEPAGRSTGFDVPSVWDEDADTGDVDTGEVSAPDDEPPTSDVLTADAPETDVPKTEPSGTDAPATHAAGAEGPAVASDPPNGRADVRRGLQRYLAGEAEPAEAERWSRVLQHLLGDDELLPEDRLQAALDAIEDGAAKR